MPRIVAPPPPSGEFQVKLQKSFDTPKLTVEVLGEPNRSAVVRQTQYDGNNKSSEKTGDVPADDVNELLRLVQDLRGFPSHPTKDVYGADVKVEFNTTDIQWANDDEDPSANEINEVAQEQKDDFKRIADSIEALARTFAKNDSAV